MAIPDPESPIGLSSLITPPSFSGLANAQQCVMRVQVFLSMGQDRVSREEDWELLDQRVYMVTTTQELRQSTINFL